MKKKPIRRKKGKAHIAAKKKTVDGHDFKSGLEVYCYTKLKENKLFEHYEDETFTLVESFTPGNRCCERQTNGKGSFTVRDGKVRGIQYTPDFTADDYIIETKGFANATFPLRWKLFKHYLKQWGDTRDIYKPQSREDVDIMVELIKLRRNTNNKN